MALTADDNLGLPIDVATGEDGWGPEYNAAMHLLDAIVMLSVISQTNTPPGSPAAGDRYLCNTAPTGAWAGQAGKIALYHGAAWEFISPRIGWMIHDQGAGVVRIAGTAGAIAVNGRDLRPTGAPTAFPIVVDPSDPTKKLLFDVSAIGTGTSRTATWRNMAITPMHVGGDTMSGELNMADNLVTRPILKDVAKRGQSGSHSMTTIDISQGNVVHITLAGNITTLDFSNWPAPGAGGDEGEVTVFFEQGGIGGYTVGYAAAVKWPGGVAPTITATLGKIDIIKFRTIDGGPNVFGEVVGQNY